MKNTTITRILFLILFMIGVYNASAQDAEKTVTITCSGSGKTQDEAKQNALRSAIEQAFGAFISSKTEVLNDNVVSDQITSVSNGNVKSYEVFSENQFSNGDWNTTLKAVISINKLTNFIQSKGIEIEIQGGLLAVNIKQQILNENGEINAVENLMGVLHEQLQTAFDFELTSLPPVSKDAESKNWEIPLEVKVITNKNMEVAATYAMKTLRSLALTKEELDNYQLFKKEVYPFCFTYGDELNLLFFRKKETTSILELLNVLFEFYTNSFKSETGFKGNFSLWKSKSIYENFIFPQDGEKLKLLLETFPKKYFTTDSLVWIDRYRSSFTYKQKTLYILDMFGNRGFKFPSVGEIVYSKAYIEKKSLAELEKITGFKVSPSPIRSKYNKGSISFILDNGQEIWLPPVPEKYEYLSFEKAQEKCVKYNKNNFTDWRLPSHEEALQVAAFFTLNNISSPNRGTVIWTSTRGGARKWNLIVYMDYKGDPELKFQSYTDYKIGDGYTGNHTLPIRLSANSIK